MISLDRLSSASKTSIRFCHPLGIQPISILTRTSIIIILKLNIVKFNISNAVVSDGLFKSLVWISNLGILKPKLSDYKKLSKDRHVPLALKRIMNGRMCLLALRLLPKPSNGVSLILFVFHLE